jgi:hypothetical protein
MICGERGRTGSEHSRTTGNRRGIAANAAMILALVLLAAPQPAQARPAVRCDTLIGFNGVAREGRFAPLIVSVENPGAALPVEVRVEVAWGSELRGTLVRRSFRSDALLPGGATRRIPFLVPMPRDARSMTVRVTSLGADLAQVEVDLRPVTIPDELVVAISSELSLDALSALSGPAGQVRIAYPRVDDLPDSWAGYDGVEVVVAHDTYFRQLRAAQVTALERWVATGGTLVFTGGAAAFQHAAAGLARLLPVEVTGLRERVDLPCLAPLLGLRTGPRGSLVLAEARLTAGAALASQDGVPVIVERRLGKGTIWFTAFDPTRAPFGAWEGLLPLWGLMMENHREPTLGDESRDPIDDPWMKALIDTPPLAYPSALAAAAFAGGYVALFVPLVLRRVSRRLGARLRIALVLFAPAAAAVAGWLLFNMVLFRPEPLLLEAAKVEVVSGDGLALVTQKLGLFAAMGGARNLVFGAADAAIDEVSPVSVSVRGNAHPRAEPPPGAEEFVEMRNDRTVLNGVSYGRFGSRLFVVTEVLPLSLTAHVTASGASVEVGVTNASGRSLAGCFLARAGRGYPIGDVGPGVSVTRVFTADDAVDLRDPDAVVRMIGDSQRVDLWSRESAGTDSGAGTVVGWLDGPALPVDVQGALRPADRPPLSLVLLEVR